jgi:fluoride exporter
MGHDEGDAHVAVPIDPDLDRDLSKGHLPGRYARPPRNVLAAVAAGGALGAPARYEMTRLIHVTAGTFPWSTFWTNISGSLVLGFSLILIIERFPPSRYVRPFFAVGFLGAYTTFSTYMVDTDLLVKDGHAGIAIAYLVASAAAGFAAVWVGIIGGRLVAQRS